MLLALQITVSVLEYLIRKGLLSEALNTNRPNSKLFLTVFFFEAQFLQQSSISSLVNCLSASLPYKLIIVGKAFFLLKKLSAVVTHGVQFLPVQIKVYLYAAGVDPKNNKLVDRFGSPATRTLSHICWRPVTFFANVEIFWRNVLNL